MRQLRRKIYTDAVAGLSGGVLARAVFEPLYDGERVVDDRV